MANISGIKTFVAGVLADAKIAESADDFEAVINDTTGLVEKCMDQICLNQLYTDKLPELDGDEKEFGAYIEEYGMGLIVPKAATVLVDGQSYGIPYFKPVVQGTFHSWKLKEYVVPGSTTYHKYKSSMKSPEAYSAFVSNVLKQMIDSYNQARYEEKKLLLGWAVDNVATTESIAKPVDTTTGEAFIRKVKDIAEAASFARDVTVDGKTITLGAAEGLTLYINTGIMSSLEVDTMAGAFNKENLAMPVNIKPVDFGAAGIGTTGAYGLIVDNRAIKLFPNRNEVGEDVSCYHDFVTISRKVQDTPFVSKFATCVALVEPNA